MRSRQLQLDDTKLAADDSTFIKVGHQNCCSISQNKLKEIQSMSNSVPLPVRKFECQEANTFFSSAKIMEREQGLHQSVKIDIIGVMIILRELSSK